MAGNLLFPIKIICCLGISWAVYRFFYSIDPNAGLIGLVITLFLWGQLFAKDVLNFFLRVKHQAEYDALACWNGRYYEFDGHHVRFYFHDEQIWIPIADLKPLLKPQAGERELRLLGSEYLILPESRVWAVSESGLDVLLKNRTAHRRADYQMIRFKRWLMQQALPNVRRLPHSSVTGRE
ncbi:hypothetical protein ACO0K0_11440 [Undibacterium sp. SXout11W]|uniref:hypothetical protein n=1 Tax=Undibacterium sp. SXout11W TaxID=3413050 RepID=UPI003BEF726A